MFFLQIVLLSGLFSIIFISLHFLFLYIFSFTLVSFSKTVKQNFIPFIMSNVICFYLVKDLENIRKITGFEKGHFVGHSLGGMICPSVPDAAITPVARDGL